MTLSRRTRARWLLPIASVLVSVVATTAVTPARASGADGAPTRVTWQSTGDSFASGEGVLGNTGACAQSPSAYGPRGARLLRDAGWEIAIETFTACTGHLVEDVFNRRTATPTQGSLWEWGREQGGAERVDVLTISFGGNDIGFADVLADCLVGLPDSWGEFLLGGIASSFTGCDISEQELITRAAALADPTRQGCTGRRADGTDGFDCQLVLEDRRGSIVDFYYDLVARHLTRRGRLYVVGYPRVFADTDQWPAWAAVACQGVKRGDAEKLGRVAERLNNVLQDAVSRANQALGSERVVFVDRFAIYRDGQHELCGRGEDWLNGIAYDRDGSGERRLETSFHPNAAGHEATAHLLVERAEATFPRGPAIIEVDGDSVAGVAFGTPAEQAIAAVTTAVGTGAASDSGWKQFIAAEDLSEDEFVDPGEFYASDDYLGESWAHRYHRVVCWGALCIHVGGDSPAGGVLRGWELGISGGRTPDPGFPPVALTGTGIRLGSSWAQVRSSYPGVVAGGGEGGSLVINNLPWEGIFDGAGSWRLAGRWDFDRPTFAPDDAAIIRLSAGEGPEPNCC